MTPFRKAERKKARLRLGICGPAGSGKTFSALLIAAGIGGRTVVIDTENGSGDLYADKFEYDIATLVPPYTPDRYINLIHEAEKAGYDVVILDSISHAWAGEGGLLDEHDKVAKASKSGNRFVAWREITPKHNAFIEAMLSSPCHIIATMRSKTEWVIDEDNKGRPRKVGMAPVQREGMDYEFTTVFDLTVDHLAKASKDRTSLFDGVAPFVPDEKTGEKFIEWLGAGVDVAAKFDGELGALKGKIHGCADMNGLTALYTEYEHVMDSWGDPWKKRALDEFTSKKHELNASPEERAA